jgi:hypothetical protein
MYYTMNTIVAKLLVMAFILWTNLGLSIAQDNNQTDRLIDWDYETIVVVRWNIDNPPIVEYDNLRFDIHFSVSDYIEADKHVRYKIYQNAECGDPNDIITDSDSYMETWVTEDDSPVGAGIDENAKRTVTVSNQLLAQTITQSKSYKEGDPGTGDDVSITYCVRLSLWNGEGTSDPDAVEINHLAVTIGLNLDLTDEIYSITGQKVEARNKGVETSDDQFFVEAFVCNKRGKPPNFVAPLRQGDTVRICIQPTEQAAEVGFRMQRIETFNFFQGITSQGAILNAEVSPNSLTDLECQLGAKQCAFETLLFSYFFQNGPEEGAVIGSGEATLQWGGEGVDRRLQFYLGSQLEGTKSIEEKEYVEIEEDERLLQERASTKTMQVPTFSIIADDGRKRPRLLADSKSTARTQQIVLASLLLIFCVVLFLPLIYYYSRTPPVQPSSEPVLVQPENELSVVDNVDDIDRWKLSIIPEDQTTVSVKSFLSKGFY